MNESSPVQPSGNTDPLDDTINLSNSVTSSNTQSINPNTNTHGYFVPVVMLIVLAVIIISTFYSKEFNGLIATVMTSGQNSELASSLNEQAIATTDAIDNAVVNTQADTVNQGIVMNNTAAELNHPAVLDHQEALTGPHIAHVHPYTYAPAVPYAAPGMGQNIHNAMMQQRRQAYEQARQERREHLTKMHEYRAIVQQRIEQDRKDMYQRLDQVEQQNRKRLEDQPHWIEQTAEYTTGRPI